MKFVIFLFFSFPVLSNTFRFPDTGARFTLKITEKLLVYESEGLRKHVELSPCSLPLAKELNAELIGRLPSSVSPEGLAFEVDEKTFRLKRDGELTKTLLMMDPRILRFLVEESRACR